MTDILIFVEDDGAANLIWGLTPLWQERGLTITTVAAGPAAKKLSQLKEDYVTVSARTTVKELLSQYQPRLVAVGTAENPDTLALLLVNDARERGIPTVGLVDAYANAAWRWRGRTDNPLAFVPDWIAVADKETKEAYESLGVPGSRIQAIGYVQVDYIATVRDELDLRGRAAIQAELFPAKSRETPVIVFVAEQFVGIDPKQSYQARIFAALDATIAAAATITPQPYLVVRLHPKNNPTDMDRYKDHIDYISYGGDGLPVVYSGDMVIGSTSTLLFEAALLGRPTVAFLSRAGDHENMPSIAAGVTLLATSVADLHKKMLEAFAASWREPAWPLSWQPGARERLAEYLRSRLHYDN